MSFRLRKEVIARPSALTRRSRSGHAAKNPFLARKEDERESLQSGDVREMSLA